MKYCLVLSAVLIARLPNDCTAARLFSSVRSATIVEESETERRHDVTSPKTFPPDVSPHTRQLEPDRDEER